MKSIIFIECEAIIEINSDREATVALKKLITNMNKRYKMKHDMRKLVCETLVWSRWSTSVIEMDATPVEQSLWAYYSSEQLVISLSPVPTCFTESSHDYSFLPCIF